MANDLKFNKEARDLMARGIKKLYDAVRVTLGPKGRNVIIEQLYGPPLVVNDGVTIAKSITLANKYENLGSSLIIEAATKTNDVVGDGTSTATILACVLIFEGLKKIETGTNPVLLKRGLDYLLKVVLTMIDEQKLLIKGRDDLLKTAINSSNSQEIGELIVQAFDAVGYDGLITILESKDIWNHLDITKGYGLDRGYVSPYMVNDKEKQLTTLDNPLILITNKKVTSLNNILWALEYAIEKGSDLLIICDDIEQEVLGSLIINNLKKIFNVVVVRAPSFGDYRDALLEDLSILTGATFINDTFTNSLSKTNLGFAKKVIITKDQTTIIDGCGNQDQISFHIVSLKKQLTNVNDYEKEKIETRIAKLTSGIALIKVGAPTETELQEKKLKFEDALNATKAALGDGIIEGGGKLVFQISECLKNIEIKAEYQAALDILSQALKAPFLQIVENGGYLASDILNKVTTDRWFDALTGEVCSLMERGIIDPASVIKTALVNAVSIASMFLTTECAITLIENIDKTINEENLL